MHIVEQAEKVLKIYSKRGDHAIQCFLHKDIDRALFYLNQREAAFSNLRILCQNFPDELNAWIQDEQTQAQWKRVSEQNRRLTGFIKQCKSEVTDRIKLNLQHKAIKKYASLASPDNRFIKRV